MTHPDAVKVLSILMSADEDNIYIVRHLVQAFIVSFPEHEETSKEEFKFYFGVDL